MEIVEQPFCRRGGRTLVLYIVGQDLMHVAEQRIVALKSTLPWSDRAGSRRDLLRREIASVRLELLKAVQLVA